MINSVKKLKHPSEVVGNSRILYWKYLPMGIYEVQMVNYPDAECTPFGTGGYMKVVCMFCKDYEDLQISTNELILIHFPYIAFVNALYRVPLRIKRVFNTLNNEHNIYVRFEKHKKRDLSILESHVTECKDKSVKDEAIDLMLVSSYEALEE